jgi:tRNA modification GTPase
VGAAIDELLSRRQLGLHLVQPWRVVIFGAPNVGKSSLINALAGYQRAIVSPIPGTTRDVLTVSTAIDGWPLQLSDTAGIRETQDELERAGIGLATSTLSCADLAILVHDAEQLCDSKSNDESHVDLSMLAPDARIIHVLNKIDVIADGERLQLLRQFTASHGEWNQTLSLSALTGEGLPELIATIGRSLVPTPSAPGSAVPFTAEQCAALETAKAAIEQHDAQIATTALHAMLTGA